MASTRRTVVVTGATAGVGRAAARAFASRGDRVALMARGERGLEATRRELEDLGAVVTAVPADVADPDQVEAAAAAVEERLGPIDVWVNNAMATVFGPFLEVEAEDYRRVTDVTYHGFVNGTRAALKRMTPRDHGVVVQVGSALAYRGIPLQSAYCGAKHAIEGFSESLRTELLHDGSAVRITMVQMPALNTPQFRWSKALMPRSPQPVPPIFQPEVAAEAIVWASLHPRREIFVGGNVPVVIWGSKLFPGRAMRYLAHNGYESQMTDREADPDRPNNLYEPVEGDFGAHGDFDGSSTPSSLQLWLTTHPTVLALGAVVAGVLLGAGARRRTG